jgi:hypothetical protein
MDKLTMYAVYNEDFALWWNVKLDCWVDGTKLEKECLFPTHEIAQNYIDDCIQENSARVYKIEMVKDITIN